MSDIVERLRQWNSASLRRNGSKLTVMAEAADAIEARDAEIERLRAYVGTEMLRSDFQTAGHMRAELDRLRALLSGRARFTEVERLRAELAAAKALLWEASKSLIEVARMPNQEHVADAHNETVKRIRAALGDKPADDAPRKQP